MATAADGPPAPPGEITNAVVHVSTIALPPDAGDFASGAVDRLGPDDALVVVFEYDAASVTPAVVHRGRHPARLEPRRLQPGHAPAHPARASGRAAVLPGSRARLLPLRGAGLVRPPPRDGRGGERGARVARGRRPRTDAESAPNTAVPRRRSSTWSAAPPTSRPSRRSCPAATPTLLAGPGPFTVFAPDDDAFAIIDLAALRRDPERSHARSSTTSLWARTRRRR